MNSKFSTVALLGLAGLLLTSTSALAVQAIVNQDADVHAKAKNSSTIVNSVSEDDEVRVLDCQGSWCKIKIPGPDGWVKKAYLTAIDDNGDPVPNIPFSFSVGPGGISIGVGGGSPPPSPPAVAQVCLYHDVNYGGAFLCYAPGEGDDHMVGAGYNDEISSIRVSGGAHVKVCNDWGFAGGCANIATDKPFLGAYDENISSFQVY